MNIHPHQNIVLPIQYLRGIAALMVVWHHVKGQISSFESVLPGSFGATGVDLFFVISGFIMYITTANTKIRPIEFMTRRIVRVVPLYWILTLTMICAWLLTPNLFKTLIVTPQTLLQSLFFIPHFSNSFPQNIFPLLVPGWTLNFEMFFYALFSLTLLIKERTRSAAISIAMIALVSIGVLWGPMGSATLITYTSPLLLEFVAGVLIGQWWINRDSGLNFGHGVVLFALGWVMLIGSTVVSGSKYITILGSIFIVIGSLNSIFLRWSNYSLKILGDSTYSLYLTHIFTLGIIRVVWVKFFSNQPSNLNAYSFAVASIISCIFIGLITYFLMERPITKYLNGRIYRKPIAGSAHRKTECIP